MECNPETEKCKEPEVDSNDDAVCQCRDGFANKTTSDGFKCVRFDPCSEDPCDQNAKCVPYGNSKQDYICVCPEGFKTFEG